MSRLGGGGPSGRGARSRRRQRPPLRLSRPSRGSLALARLAGFRAARGSRAARGRRRRVARCLARRECGWGRLGAHEEGKVSCALFAVLFDGYRNRGQVDALHSTPPRRRLNRGRSVSERSSLRDGPEIRIRVTDACASEEASPVCHRPRMSTSARSHPSPTAVERAACRLQRGPPAVQRYCKIVRHRADARVIRFSSRRWVRRRRGRGRRQRSRSVSRRACGNSRDGRDRGRPASDGASPAPEPGRRLLVPAPRSRPSRPTPSAIASSSSRKRLTGRYTCRSSCSTSADV